MFGYVKPYTPELKVADHEKYRAVYCGVCRQIGKTSGQLSRLGLTYDIVLLCSVRMVLRGIEPRYTDARCLAHPAKKRMILVPNEAVEFTAAAFAALAAAKNNDDLADEHGVQRIKPLILAPVCAHMKKCAKKALPDGTDETLAELLGRLASLEKSKSPSADLTSDAFGDLLGFLFSLGLDGDAHTTAEVIGRCVGKFIYMCDAADDLADDCRRDRYNPLRYGWGELALTDGRVSDLVLGAVTASTPLALSELERAVETLDGGHPLTPIIKNIVYLGLPASLRRVLSGKDKTDNKKHFDA